MNVYGYGWPTDEDINLFWQNQLMVIVSAPHSGSFSYVWTKTGLLPDTYEIMAISDSYTVTTYFTIPCPVKVMITGTETAVFGQEITLTAAVIPTTVAQPITYTWQINGGTPIIQSDGLTNTLTFTMPDANMLRVIVAASNQYIDSTQTAHLINILSRRTYLPVIQADH